MKDLTKNPLFVFLGAVISAFVAGAGLLMFLDDRYKNPSYKDLQQNLRLHNCGSVQWQKCSCPDGYRKIDTNQEFNQPVTNGGADGAAILLCAKHEK